MEKPNELFLIMPCDDFRYCIYRVCEPESNEDEDIVYTLDEPVMKFHNESCPDGMSFAVIGKHIFMVGGYHAHCENNPFRLSNETIIFDTESNTYSPGPPLISPKPDPFLFTVGFKLYALCCDIYASDASNIFVGPKPRFEVLDTENIESGGWRALPVPSLHVTQQNSLYPVIACVGLSTGIFITVENAGTYAFDLVHEVWSYVSDDQLPFIDQALPMPPNIHGASSLCFAQSTQGYGRHSVFHIHYETEHMFKADEIQLDSSLLGLSAPLPPPELYYQWPLLASDSRSLIYLVDTGVDNPNANDTNVGSRYIKVQVCNVSFGKKKIKVEHEFPIKCQSSGHGDEEKAEAMVENTGEFSECFGKKIMRDSIRKCTSTEQKSEFQCQSSGHADEEKAEAMVENTGEFSECFGEKIMRDSIRKCTSTEQKSEFQCQSSGHADEEKAEVMVENTGEFSECFGKKFMGDSIRKCTSTEQKSEFQAEVEDIGKLLKVGTSTLKREKNGEKDETFKLNPVWRRSFFGGPMVDIGEHVYAAFAIKR